LLRRQQQKLKVFSGGVTLGSVLMLEGILNEGSLICGKALSAAAEMEEGVAVPDKDGCETCRCIRHQQVLVYMASVPEP
jgi:hypothetical protein